MATTPHELGDDSMALAHSLRRFSRHAQFALDALVLVAAFFLAYLLRFDFAPPTDEWRFALLQAPFVAAAQFAALSATGVYRFMWRYVGFAEAKTFAVAALVSALPLLAARAALPDVLQVGRVPLSVIVVDTALAFGGVLVMRMARRDLYERNRRRPAKGTLAARRRILLIGAGRAGVLAAAEIQSRGDSDLHVRGFVDDDVTKTNSVIGGVRVLGTTRDLPRLVREYGIDHVVISIATASRREFKRLLEVCASVPIKVRVIPGLYEILQGRVKISRIRDIQIEDLLGREPVQLDVERVESFIAGRTIMVTGAGGSIGSELVRQIARFAPGNLLLVERAEFALFGIEQELRASNPGLAFEPLIADVCDEPRMRRIFAEHRPAVVVHAAAHKHVPMMEANCAEAVKNNVFGTRLVGQLAGEFGAEAFVLVSTDKAVRPTSVMGATKRVAELVVQDLNVRFATRFVAVRFGNVIGSAGSVIPIFREQIMRGGPVTVTHPDMVRFFMTIPEASQLVLEAGTIGKGGEIFVLDMGDPVRILDLAKETIRLSGLRPSVDIDIEYTGIRPGEKLVEELASSGERITKTRHPKIFIGEIAAAAPHVLGDALVELDAISRAGGDAGLRDALRALLPESALAGKGTAHVLAATASAAAD